MRIFTRRAKDWQRTRDEGSARCEEETVAEVENAEAEVDAAKEKNKQSKAFKKLLKDI